MTGNEVETICQVLSLVGPVFTMVDDSLMPQDPSLFLSAQPWYTDRSPGLGDNRSGEGGGSASASPSLASTCPLSLLSASANVFVCVHVDEGGGDRVLRVLMG